MRVTRRIHFGHERRTRGENPDRPIERNGNRVETKAIARRRSSIYGMISHLRNELGKLTEELQRSLRS